MAQLQNVTVNGAPATQYLSKKKSEEISRFIAEEMWQFGKMCSRHCCSRSTKSHEYRRGPIFASVQSEEERHNLDLVDGEV
jgi:hypothetical protein